MVAMFIKRFIQKLSNLSRRNKRIKLQPYTRIASGDAENDDEFQQEVDEMKERIGVRVEAPRRDL